MAHTKEQIIEIASRGMTKGEAKRLQAMCNRTHHTDMAISPVYGLPYQVLLLYASKVDK